MGAQFTKTGITNLIRHSSGNYYLQAKIEGKKVRKSLKTKSKDVARYRLAEALDLARCQARGVLSLKSSSDPSRVTWSALVTEWLATQRRRPELKENTLTYYQLLAGYLAEAFPADFLAARVTPLLAAEWWSGVARARPASVANNLLASARGVIALSDALGLRGGAPDPFAACGRVSVSKCHLIVPTASEMEQLLQSIREIKKAHSRESVDLVEFLAFTGMRIGEARAVTWSDVGADFLTITGGVTGTKNREFRRVPILPRVRLLLEARKPLRPVGQIFTIRTPREALSNACRRLKLPHMRVHDLRHFFATQCIEKGVDLPTLAKWLGHKDGGVLAMKTYGHIRDDHSLEMVKKLG